MTGVYFDLHDDTIAVLEAEFVEKPRAAPGDIVLMEDGALGIWQKTCAYGLTMNGWGLSPRSIPIRVFGV